MGLRLDRVSLRRVGIVLALGVALFAYGPSPAHATTTECGTTTAGCAWQSGPVVESSDTNCVDDESEAEAGTWLDYLTNPSSPPQTGETYYVAIDLYGIGDTCAGIYADVNLELPSGTSLAISASDPVYCFLKFPNSSSYKRDTADCPQSLGSGPDGYSLDPVHANPPFWPLPQGGAIEIQVPVTSSTAGDLQFEGVVNLADGQSDPQLTPTLSTIVDSSGAQNVGGQDEQIGVFYNAPTLTSNVQQTNHSTTVQAIGWVDNYSNPGNVVGEVNYAGSGGNCNTVGAHVYTTTPAASLQSPNTELTTTFTGLYADVAYCYRLVATVTSGAEAGTYYGNWQYFITNGTYYTFAGEPAAAIPPAVQQCSENDANGNGCGYSGCSSSTCTSSGTTTGTTEALDLTVSGSGSGTVTGPAGFSCSASCTGNFASGSTVTLTAAAKSGSSFLGWSGGGCSGTGTCKVTMSAAESVTADFVVLLHLETPTLLVSLTGTGSGKVSSPGGISCPSTCSHVYSRNARDTLTATATPGSTFEGWSGGGCSGTGTCAVLMAANKSVTAEFTLNPPHTDTLTVSLGGTGSGKVTSSGGISCPSTCDHTYTTGTTDTLSAAAAPGSKFTGWSGGGCSGTGACKVTVSSALDVTAQFALDPPSCSLSVVSSKIALRKRRKSPPVDTLVVSVKCSQAVSARVGGTVTEQLTRKDSKRFKLGSLTANLLAGVGHAFDLKLPASAVKGLKHGHRESVSLSLTASNANGSATARGSAGRLRGSG